jgi:hypothetical protein
VDRLHYAGVMLWRIEAVYGDIGNGEGTANCRPDGPCGHAKFVITSFFFVKVATIAGIVKLFFPCLGIIRVIRISAKNDHYQIPTTFWCTALCIALIPLLLL